MTPQHVMDLHAKSFSWAARFLLPEARRDAAQLYAFARLADDLADEDALGEWAERMAQLQALESNVLNPGAGSELGHQVGKMLRSKSVNTEVVRNFMDCLIQDASPRCIQTTEELLQFAYGAAGTVGQMMCPILGASNKGQPYATALGVAMQLTNIARDVVEDAVRGRCYIPAQWGVSAQALRAPKTPAQAVQSFATIQKLLHLADDFYAYSQKGLVYIPAGNRRAIRVAAALYRGIGQKILGGGADRYWRGRTSLGRFEKIKLILACYADADQFPSTAVRDVMGNDLKHLALVPGFPANV
ncbi:MAG: phytoene/squalene synthase family protein [Polaromonas sp.]